MGDGDPDPDAAFPPGFLARTDPSPDTGFYPVERFVTHIDDRAIAAVGQLYDDLGIDGRADAPPRGLGPHVARGCPTSALPRTASWSCWA